MVCAAVASVRAQRGPVVEVVVVDDGSNDDTEAALASNFPDIVYLRLPESAGPGRARNAGAAVASGELLMFLDSDDRWLPDHAAELAAVIERGYGVAYGTTLTNDHLTAQRFMIPEAGDGPAGDCLAALCRWCFLVPSSVALTRAAFTACGGFPAERLGEDWPFFVRLAREFAFGFAGPQPITVRELHTGSLCASQGREVLLAALRQVRQAVEDEAAIDPRAVARFETLEQWIKQRTAGGASVQDWYGAMQEEGLI